VGVPFDFCNSEDIAAAISKWGKIISWEREDALKGKILVKARVTELIGIPKSIRWSEGEQFEEESWTCSVEVLLEEMLGGGPTDEDPIPPDGVDPNHVPQHANDFPGFQPLPIHNIHAPNEDWDDWEEQEEQDQHWAFPQPEPFHPQQHQVEIPALPEDGAPNSSITTTVSLSDGLFSITHSASEEVNQGVPVPPIGQGLLNIALAYNAIGEEEDL
jgi:hypothetical protein